MRKNIFDLKCIQIGIILAAFMVGSCNSPGNDNIDEENTAQVENTPEEEGDFVQIFDGETLEGWQGDTTYWKAENGSLVGQVTPTTLLERNTFIIWQGGQPADFELKADFRITTDGNSGINYRSVALDTIPFALKGYQADIDGKINYTGQNYEERGRTTLAYRGQKVLIDPMDNATGSLRDNIENNAWTGANVTGTLGTSDSLKTLINSEDWNEIHLIVEGNRMQHYVNGVLMSDVTDNDTANRKLKGMLGVQVHVGPPMKVEYRNIQLKQL